MIPVNIISGFLGAGKTTAIIRLLEQKQPDECWAIVVNEFGKISIDGQTLQSKSVVGSVFDISGGCICCSAKTYLKENLEKIVETIRFDRIIIEPSGLGGIEMVRDIIETMPELELMLVICMVDMTTIDNPKLQRNMIYLSQIRMSDCIVFSKRDLMESTQHCNELQNKFKILFPGKHCITEINIQSLLPDSFSANQSTAVDTQLFVPAHLLNDANYIEHAFELEKDQITDSGKLEKLCIEHPSVIRAKGFIHTHNGWELFNYTLSKSHTEPSPEQSAGSLVVIAEKSTFDLAEFTEKLFI